MIQTTKHQVLWEGDYYVHVRNSICGNPPETRIQYIGVAKMSLLVKTTTSPDDCLTAMMHGSEQPLHNSLWNVPPRPEVCVAWVVDAVVRFRR